MSKTLVAHDWEWGLNVWGGVTQGVTHGAILGVTHGAILGQYDTG